MVSRALLDGRHRLDLLEKLGIEVVDAGGKLIVQHRIVIIPDDADAVSQVMSLNFYRRHLDIKERRALAMAMLKNQPEKSDRLIGKILDLSHPTIAKERKELEAAGEVVKISTSTDWRGRKQPRRKKTVKRADSATTTATTRPRSGLQALQAAWDKAGTLVRAEFLRGLGREALREAIAEIDAADARTDVQRIADRAEARAAAAKAVPGIDEAAP
jgi:DNA-binding MarR family transcriptional regulator